MMPDDHNEIMHALGEIKGLLKGVEDWRNVVDKRLNSHADRIGVLERWQSKLFGVAAFVSVPALVAIALKVWT